jgi:ribosomal-protein-alanine N-acetyltransferase
MSLRFAFAGDVQALEALHAQAFDQPWGAAEIERLMRIMGGFVVISEDGGPEGFILVRTVADEGEILTLAVAPAVRRRGVGRVLVEAAAAEAERRGAQTLFLEVAEDNPGALALYESAGFSRAGLRRAYYARPNTRAADALVLRRPLNTAGA